MYQNSEKFDFSVRNEENLGPLEILVKYCEDHQLEIESNASFAYVWSTLILPTKNPDLLNLWDVQ